MAKQFRDFMGQFLDYDMTFWPGTVRIFVLFVFILINRKLCLDGTLLSERQREGEVLQLASGLGKFKEADGSKSAVLDKERGGRS
ncbi:hypothetical protein J1N35_033795 [Gossypium stocksii]|uniref:Uncharacterized protein n=1 Tax=Gossypium stocksii TaxID=47602 RepID=A0A9D3URC6_9ROSI|nr:hypothetical protein J1N35_033795 [Gossypium stocksii]